MVAILNGDKNYEIVTRCQFIIVRKVKHNYIKMVNILYLNPFCFSTQSHGKGHSRVQVTTTDTNGDIESHNETKAPPHIDGEETTSVHVELTGHNLSYGGITNQLKKMKKIDVQGSH